MLAYELTPSHSVAVNGQTPPSGVLRSLLYAVGSYLSADCCLLLVYCVVIENVSCTVNKLLKHV